MSARRFFKTGPLLLLVNLALVLFSGQALAQLQVSIKTSRTGYVIHEPLLVTLTLTNLAGREIVLDESGGIPWLDFRIASHSSNRPATRRRSAGPISPPIELAPGQTIIRAFDLNRYFLLEEMGTTVITAEVRFSAINRIFSSNRVLVEITDGRVLWTQTLGLPGTSDFRRISLLSARLENKNLAYLRVANPETYTVYITRPLGQILLMAEPQAQIDSVNNIHFLFMNAPKVYLHYIFQPDGKQLDRVIYRATQTRPLLSRTAAGDVGVVGGLAEIPRAVPSADSSPPSSAAPAKLSERPPGLPQVTPQL